MIVVLCGYSKVNFQTVGGDHIEGINLYVTYEENNVIGEKSDRFFVKKEIPTPNLSVGSHLDVSFNNRGKVSSISVIK